MNLEDFGRVADALLLSIETILFDWFPNGVVDGREFCIGSSSGEAGQSLRVRLNGEKAGIWSDFSLDEGGHDLISLYAFKEGLSQGKACAVLARELGIELTQTDPRYAKKTPLSFVPKKTQKSAPAQAAQGVESKKPRTEWEPVLPVPGDAGPFPLAHIKRGRPERYWEYLDQQGQLLGVIYRFITSDGGKEVLPCVYARHAVTGKCEWRWISFRDPRPLYIRTAFRTDLPVVVVEGEKCADAAYDLVGGLYDIVSWPGGGKAVSKADWSGLAGRRVILWADADAKVYKDNHALAGQLKPEHEQPGMSTMLKLAEILRSLGCDTEFVDIPAPGAKPDGWDVADMIAEGSTAEDVLAWLGTLRAKAALALPEPVEIEDAIPAYLDEVPMLGTVSNVVQLRAAGGKSTPSAASAGSLPRRDLRSMMIATSSGGVKGCRENVYTALRHDPCLTGLVALDQFTLLQVKRKDPPWASEPGEWTEGDDFHLGMYLANHYGLVLASVGDIEKAVAQSARENAFNPVIEMLDACADAWDGVARVDKAFHMYWGAVDSEYMSLISTMFFVGLAKRAYEPGVKHDCAPVFEGSQGMGKSTALSILGGEWFADTPFRMGEKDGYLAIQGVLIYEIAELEQFNRSEVTAVKAFMSSRVDRYREPYGRRMRNQARRTAFAATTNQDEYFKDMTGNRRFWPVDTRKLDLEGLTRDRAQLLGEAVHLMRKGVKWFPTPEQQMKLITPHQESRELSDEWTGRVWEYLEGLDSDGKKSALSLSRIDRVTTREILVKALHFELSKIGAARSETTRVGNIMRKFGWIGKRDTDGARERYYTRPLGQELVADQGGHDDLPL